MAATHSLDFLKVDAWRAYFERNGLDEFEVIENAMAAAAKHRPDEFLERRAYLTEILYAKKKPSPRRKENSDGTSVSSPPATPKLSNVPSSTGKAFSRNPDGNHSRSDYKQSSSPPSDVNNAPSRTGKCFFRSPDRKQSMFLKVLTHNRPTSVQMPTNKGPQAAPQITTRHVQDVLKATRQDEESSVGAKQEPSREAHDHRLTRTTPACALNDEVKLKEAVTGNTCTKKRQESVQECNKTRITSADDAATEMKLETSKRKLQEGYRQWKNGESQSSTSLNSISIYP